MVAWVNIVSGNVKWLTGWVNNVCVRMNECSAVWKGRHWWIHRVDRLGWNGFPLILVSIPEPLSTPPLLLPLSWCTCLSAFLDLPTCFTHQKTETGKVRWNSFFVKSFVYKESSNKHAFLYFWINCENNSLQKIKNTK